MDAIAGAVAGLICGALLMFLVLRSDIRHHTNTAHTEIDRRALAESRMNEVLHFVATPDGSFRFSDGSELPCGDRITPRAEDR